MTHLYVDCQYGISGDMMLSALVDLGADPAYIADELRKLPIDDFEMSFQSIDEKGMTCQQLLLDIEESDHHHDHDHKEGQHHHHDHEEDHDHHHSHEEGHDHDHHHAHRQAQDILKMIEDSELADRVKERSLALFEEVARAEGKIHGMPVEEVHFHEVGAMDSIIDMIGVCLALEDLGIDELTFAPVATGYGKIEIAHGLYPVPAPATLEILTGVPLADFSAEGELTTPTGAAFAKVLASDYQHHMVGQVEKVGYGAGTRHFDHPNVLRVVLTKKKNA